MRCKRHELCIVEPGSTNQCCEAARSIMGQVAGLIVTTQHARPNDIWEVSPTPSVRIYQHCTDTHGVAIDPGLYEVYLPDAWLRPLRGESRELALIVRLVEGAL